MAKKEISIVKANGEREPFLAVKLENSLLRANTDPSIISEVIDEIQKELEENYKEGKKPLSTKYIYKRAFTILSHKKRSSASRYGLRKAVMGLGPTGFPFEEFVARIFRARGYQSETNRIVQGTCVDHEIDVAISNENELHFVEAKFHNQRGINSGVKTALYTKARFDDLKDRNLKEFNGRKIDQSWLVTNTKFTSSAIQYGTCAGLVMIGWNYPASGNLQELIEETELQPMTVLTTVPESAKRFLLESGAVLCRSLQDNDEAMREAGLNQEEIKAIKQEVDDVCGV